MKRMRAYGSMFIALGLVAQETTGADLLNLRSSLGGSQQSTQAAQILDALPKDTTSLRQDTGDASRLAAAEQERINQEIQAARKREKGPRRFASDLFDSRRTAPLSTEGGIADDYVLGTGDLLRASTFGSATFEMPLQVDGRGNLVVPKVGPVRVAGLTLGRAREVVQAKVGRMFSSTTVDLSVVKLRDVRVFVLGEVYRPGSFLVPSLSSLVNVLGLSGGPTAVGSYRQVRVVRGGKVIHQLDLYPLRAEGLGNMNFYLQSGDTIFVPLALNPVSLEGAFTRVVAATGDLLPSPGETRNDLEIQDLQENIDRLELRLATPTASRRSSRDSAEDTPEPGGRGQVSPRDKDRDPAAIPDLRSMTSSQGDALTQAQRTALEDQLRGMRQRLRILQDHARGDQRVPEQVETDALSDSLAQENAGLPSWLVRWKKRGLAPSMQFEMLPGETAADALRFAGGLAIEAFDGNLNLRHLGGGEVLDSVDIPRGGESQVELHRGDVLTAMYRRTVNERTVQVRGWARVPGTFARKDGLRVGDLLRNESELLPDTYLHRGEIIRTAPDLTTRYLAFEVDRALAGDGAHNLVLEDRDRIELYRTTDFRRVRTVTVVGPVSRPGTFPFHDGMRASDLLFQAGIPLREANRFVAEISHTREGKGSETRPLDLTRLLSSEAGSPVQLTDNLLNPLLEPLDQVSVFAKPYYRTHHTINLTGQVARPGVYTLDAPKVSLREIIARAGGLTSEAMPQGAIFLRQVSSISGAKDGPGAKESKAAKELRNALGKEKDGKAAGNDATTDPTSNGINGILDRLSETKRQPSTGALLKTPLLHGLEEGNLNRLIVNIPAILAGDSKLDVDLQDGDEIIIPRATDAAYVVGETASPFMTYKVTEDLKVRDLLRIAGGLTRNADSGHIRLLKADGRILDSGVMGQKIQPGDAVLVPQKVRRDVTWQENLQALTPLAIILNTVK